MVVVIYFFSFLWGVVILPVCFAIKKVVERTKTLPLGMVINFICSLIFLVFSSGAFYLPLFLGTMVKPPDWWGGLFFWVGILFYAFLKREFIKAYIKDVHQKEGTHDTPGELAAEIIEMEWRCKKCGMPNKYPYEKSSPMYGSPLFVCPKCGCEQADYRHLEPALDRRFGNWNVRRISIKVNVVSFIVSVALTVLVLNIPVSTRGIFVALLFGTATVFVASVIVTIESLLKKKPDFIKKSELRLQNKEYVAQLRKHGYEVPRKL